MKTLFLFLTLLLPMSLNAQSTADQLLEARTALAVAVDANNLDAIREHRATFERLTADAEYAALAHYYAALADYRLANVLMGEDDGEALKHVDLGIDHLQAAVKLDAQFAEAWALLASLYGRKAGFRPLEGMILGPKADGAMNKAKRLAPDNPRVVYLDAMSDYHKPKMFGGNPERGIQKMRHALTLFAQQTPGDPLQPTWGHDETYAWLGIAMAQAGNIAEARSAYEYALQINPNNQWVRHFLLPSLDR